MTSQRHQASPTEYETQTLIQQVRYTAQPLQTANDLDSLMDAIGDARYVLIGAPSHGTSEYYTWRARLSQRLIKEKGFSFVSVEGDWPDCYRVNRYVKGYPDAGESAYQVLHAFERWPTWMWANWEVVAFTEWLRRHNSEIEDASKVGFYGLDVYSLWESMQAVIEYLDEVDPEAAKVARQAYQCFEPFSEDAQAYALETAVIPSSCEDEVVDLLKEIRNKAHQYDHDLEASFNAEQNARVMVNAETYYRAMVGRGPESWNIRDHHMADTLQSLMDFHGREAKGIVWAHNTHVGDARATDMARGGMVNIGQLVREEHGDEGVMLVGFGSDRGSVTAGSSWGAQMERMTVPESQPGTWENVLHRAGGEDWLLLLEPLRKEDIFLDARGQRAIGVVYNPAWEHGNFVPTNLPERYDAFLYIDETEALNPLHIQPGDGSKPPETYPWGL